MCPIGICVSRPRLLVLHITVPTGRRLECAGRDPGLIRTPNHRRRLSRTADRPPRRGKCFSSQSVAARALLLVHLIPHRRLNRRYSSHVAERSAARDLVYNSFKTRTADARDKLKPPRALRRALRPTRTPPRPKRQRRYYEYYSSLVEGGVAIYRVYRHAAYVVSMISAIYSRYHGVLITV